MDNLTLGSNTTEHHLNAVVDVSQIKTIDETIKMPPPPENIRICLVGRVVDDRLTIEAAQSFGVEIVTSQTGSEFIDDTHWTTYFILDDFETTIYETIHKAKHKIMGPPALQHAAQLNNGLPTINRPIYNYSMKGVKACFEGIRKKDELTRLVYLIYAMGGSIRKEHRSSTLTHMICIASNGVKYHYGKIFNLSVLRPGWIYDAWNQRDDVKFIATTPEFQQNHKLTLFEGLKICFLGFPENEKQHMIEVLMANGGKECEIDDVECSHVILPNTDAHFPDILNQSPDQLQTSSSSHNKSAGTKLEISKRDIVHRIINFDKSVDSNVIHEEVNENDEDEQLAHIERTSTPTGTGGHEKLNDGAVLHSNDDNGFVNPNNLSPIAVAGNDEYFGEGGLDRILEEEDSETPNKRKRDSFDDISMISIDSLAPSFASAKKPKLIRTGSITRTLRRSMSFVALKTPVSNLFRSRRNSVDPNSSYSSITSIESTFNESIKKPIQEKLKGMRDRLARSCKSDLLKTPKMKKKSKAGGDNENTPNIAECYEEPDHTVFKTPNLPPCHINNHTVYGDRGFENLKSHSPPPHNSTPSHSATIVGKHHSQSQHHSNDNKIGTPSRLRFNSNDVVDDLVGTTKSTVSDNSICPVVVAADTLPVVDEHMIQTIPTLVNNRTHILKADWFWYTIQDGCAEEERHKFDDYLKSILNTPGRRDSHPTPNKNKRKQRFDGTPVSTSKRRSSVSDAGLLSMSGSLLDYTISPDKHESRGKHISDTEPTIEEKSSKKASMRYNHFMDFFHTESNYVGILNTILNLFKIPLEQDKDEDKMILNKSEIKSIFSNFLPIHQVHKHMLDSLEKLRTNWSEDGSIGQIIMDNRNDLIKAYPPYVNFFEQMKEALIQCDKENPRFHAFLKINQSKPECGRQSLQDLMIRPVQRLPSISLLLNDILKHTSKSNPDHRKLDDALKAIKEVMTYINEDKRKTEGQLAMFDIFNDIDNCPPHLVSSHRNFVSKCEVTELSDNLSGRGDSLMLFLFSDTLEMCKKRSRGHSAKSPSTTISGLNTTRMTTTKPYKHIKLLPLSAIRFVYDIRDSPRAFSLVCKSNQDAKEKMYSFNICDEEIDKIIYLRGVCKQLAENACVTDTDNFMATVESQEIDIDISEVNLGTLSKAYKFATRTRLKVGRAFSFHKTPSKLKRAVSTMIPSPFGSTNSIQATSQLANMKLGSCNNINEVQEENSDNSPTSSEILIAPMSVQPVRKAKGATIAVSTLRRI